MFFFFSNNPWWVLKNCLHGDLPSINRFFFVNIYHAVSPKLNTLVVINTRILIGSNLDINFSPAAEVLYTDFLILLRLKGRWQIISILAAWKGQSATGKGARKPSEFQNDESFGSVSSHRDSSANHPTTHLKSCYFHGSLDWLQGSWEKKQKIPYFEWSPPWHTILTWFLTYHISCGHIYIYGIYILTFYLACTLKFFLAFFWHSIWHLFWHSFWHHLASILVLSLASILTFCILSGSLSGILSDISSDILSGVLSGILSGMSSGPGAILGWRFGVWVQARSTASWAGDLVFRRRRWRRKKRRRRSCTFLKI